MVRGSDIPLDEEDYEISFVDHKNGKVTVTVKGRKGFTGTITKVINLNRSKQTGSDGTAFGPGASLEAAEAALAAMKSDGDPKGTKYAPLKLKSTKQTKKNITVKWTKVSGAKKYILYGNKCGKKYKMKKIGTYSGKSKKVTKVAGKKLKKSTYYKFIVIAVDSNNNVISTSKLIHVSTKGSKKKANPTKVKVKAKLNKNGKKLKKYKSTSAVGVKKGKTVQLKTTAAKKKGTKVKKHRVVKYESSNKAVATVTSKGKIKGVNKGKCTIYVYAQNGIAKKTKVNVK